MVQFEVKLNHSPSPDHTGQPEWEFFLAARMKATTHPRQEKKRVQQKQKRIHLTRPAFSWKALTLIYPDAKVFSRGSTCSHNIASSHDRQTLSHYRIVEKLGGGATGAVYKAEDTRA